MFEEGVEITYLTSPVPSPSTLPQPLTPHVQVHLFQLWSPMAVSQLVIIIDHTSELVSKLLGIYGLRKGRGGSGSVR